MVPQMPRTHSISLSLSSSFSSVGGDSARKMTRALSESDLRDLSVVKKKPFSKTLDGFEEEEEEAKEERGFGFRCAAKAASSSAALDVGLGLFSSSGLDEGCELGMRDNGLVSVLVGGGVGGGGGRICGGGGGGNGGSDGGDGDGGSSGFWDSNHGNHSTDVYYQKMIEANPGNPLLLSNYAKFLKDVSFFESS